MGPSLTVGSDRPRSVPSPLSQSRPNLDIFPQEPERDSSFLQPYHETSGVVSQGDPKKVYVYTNVSGQGNPLRSNDQEPITERVRESNEGIVEFVNDSRKKKGMPEGTIPHGNIQNSKRHSRGIEKSSARRTLLKVWSDSKNAAKQSMVQTGGTLHPAADFQNRNEQGGRLNNWGRQNGPDASTGVN